MKKTVKTMRDYNFKYHLVGRIWTALALVLFLSVPISLGIYYGEAPNWAIFTSTEVIALITPFIINFLSGVAEPFLYAPMLGTNSEYLAFITGNLSNLKIPCVVRAHKIYETKAGTEEHEIISTIAVATSTLVTVVIIAIVVLCLSVSNLQSVIEKNTWIQPAFSCVVYALFGSLGGKYVAKNPKLSLIPAAIVVALSLILGFTGMKVGSAYLFVGIGVCALFAVLEFLRERRKKKNKEEQERLAGIGDSHDLSEGAAISDGEAESAENAKTADEEAETAENSAENTENEENAKNEEIAENEENVIDKEKK